jgi:hypothetical protein
MSEIVRPCVYFERPGKANTARVVEVVMERLNAGDITTVVVASTTGYTALKFAEALEARGGMPPVRLISIAEGALIREWGTEYPSLKAEDKQELERRGVVVADRVAYLLHSSLLDYSEWKFPGPEEMVRETLYAFGQGLKVAVEVALMAVACGFLEPFQKVIAVGGTSRGADTAIVARATYPNHFFSKEKEKRFVIYEILCKPL